MIIMYKFFSHKKRTIKVFYIFDKFEIKAALVGLHFYLSLILLATAFDIS